MSKVSCVSSGKVPKAPLRMACAVNCCNNIRGKKVPKAPLRMACAVNCCNNIRGKKVPKAPLRMACACELLQQHTRKESAEGTFANGMRGEL